MQRLEGSYKGHPALLPDGRIIAPLWEEAIIDGNDDLLYELIEKVPDVNYVDLSSVTLSLRHSDEQPLILAIRYENLTAVSALLAAGANPNMRSEYQGPMDTALSAYPLEIAMDTGNEKIIELQKTQVRKYPVPADDS